MQLWTPVTKAAVCTCLNPPVGILTFAASLSHLCFLLFAFNPDTRWELNWDFKAGRGTNRNDNVDSAVCQNLCVAELCSAGFSFSHFLFPSPASAEGNTVRRGSGAVWMSSCRTSPHACPMFDGDRVVCNIHGGHKKQETGESGRELFPLRIWEVSPFYPVLSRAAMNKGEVWKSPDSSFILPQILSLPPGSALQNQKMWSPTSNAVNMGLCVLKPTLYDRSDRNKYVGYAWIVIGLPERFERICFEQMETKESGDPRRIIRMDSMFASTMAVERRSSRRLCTSIYCG